MWRSARFRALWKRLEPPATSWNSCSDWLSITCLYRRTECCEVGRRTVNLLFFFQGTLKWDMGATLAHQLLSLFMYGLNFRKGCGPGIVEHLSVIPQPYDCFSWWCSNSCRVVVGFCDDEALDEEAMCWKRQIPWANTNETEQSVYALREDINILEGLEYLRNRR